MRKILVLNEHHVCYVSYITQHYRFQMNRLFLLNVKSDLDMVDFAAHCTIRTSIIGFQKYYILPGKCCP